MQSVRINNRLPQVYRTCSRAPARNMSLFYPRFVTNEFAPMFRLLDDLQTVSRPTYHGRCSNKQRSFQPRFDVIENQDSYELKGELPGIDQKNIEVAFTDEKTLVIKGHTQSRNEPTTQVEAQPEQTTETQSEKAPASESDTSSYQKASVEDEYVDVGESDAKMSGGNGEATPAETPKEVSSEEAAPQEVAAPVKTEQPKRWISERSVGRFSRSWTFPKRVDQENVTASLSNGILSIIVPKAPAPENRRIEIQ